MYKIVESRVSRLTKCKWTSIGVTIEDFIWISKIQKLLQEHIGTYEQAKAEMLVAITTKSFLASRSEPTTGLSLFLHQLTEPTQRGQHGEPVHWRVVVVPRRGLEPALTPHPSMAAPSARGLHRNLKTAIHTTVQVWVVNSSSAY